MAQYVLLGLAGVVALGIAAQWLAWRLRVPSILLLLAFGVAAGPLTGLLRPDELFGRLLLPGVSLSVAVILFEGGLSLKVRELRAIGSDLLRLTTVGALVTWLVSLAAARFLLGFDWPLAALLAAILVVTGPTVIAPILRHLRLGGRVGAVLKWEGIVIDPLGATLALLTFVVARAGGWHGGAAEAALALLRTAVVGGGLGLLGAGLLIVPLARYWIPDALHGAVALAVVFLAFAVANALQEESGLLAVTVMGIGLANHCLARRRHLIEFKENLTVLLVSCLFILLAAPARRRPGRPRPAQLSVPGRDGAVRPAGVRAAVHDRLGDDLAGEGVSVLHGACAASWPPPCRPCSRRRWPTPGSRRRGGCRR